MNKVAQRFGIKTELGLRDIGYEFRAGFTSWIKKLFARLVSMKMRFILRTEKCRLMMIEPPGQLRRWRIFEVDDRVLVSIKHLFIKQIARSMKQPAVMNIGAGNNSLAIKPGECCRRGNAVKAVAVVKNA